MKKLLLILVLLFTINNIAQVTNEGKPRSWKTLDDSANFVPNVLPNFDLNSIIEEDLINDELFDRPWRFGFMHSVDYGFDQGQWATLPNGDRVWRILISSQGALSLNVIFDDFFMPEGGMVYLYNNDRSDLLGAYTSVQNQDSGILGTWLVKGDSLWIEYLEPANVTGQGRLHIAKATHGYRNAETFNMTRGLNDSGACNLDVDCPIGNDWQDYKDNNKKASGIMLSSGFGFCSGSLINNTANDGTPYFLTANHCTGGNPAAWAFRFGWISPDPVCASNTNSTQGPTTMTISGSTMRANNGGSDFALLELNNAIPVGWNRVYAGWDSTDDFPTFQVGIHHPSGDIMKVCRDDDPASKQINNGAQTWEIEGGANGGWELGVTEGGSSGSPLFDQNGRIIGQLFGGLAACSGTNDNDQYDFYGRLGVSWDGGSASNRLRDWLDPLGIDPGVWDSNPPLMTFALDGGVGVSIPAVNCGNTEIEPTITLVNNGTSDINTATIEWDLDGGPSTTINFVGTLAQNESETFDLGTINLTTGMHDINASLTDVNGMTDDNPSNDDASSSIDIVDADTYETNQVHFELLTDNWAEETSWEFRNAAGTVLYSFGPYQQNVDDNTLFNYDFDVVDDECYFFEIFDTAGDGICCGFGNGYYELSTDDSTVIFAGGNFGSSELTEMAIDGSLGVNNNLAQNVVLYPNPTTGLLNINITNGYDELDYNIVNILGQSIKRGQLTGSTNSIDLTDLTTGLYFVSLTDKLSNETAVTKLIKQ